MHDTGAPTEPQMVRCEKHGYFYNPRHATGCRQCVAAAVENSLSMMPPRPRRLRGRLILIGLIGVMGWAGFGFLKAMGRRGGEVYVDSKATEGRVNPGLVRMEIEELEALVYAESATLGLGEQIEYASLVLHDAVMREAAPILAGRIGPAILAFGSMAAGADHAGYSLMDLVEVRRRWEETRADAFWEVDWYRSADP